MSILTKLAATAGKIPAAVPTSAASVFAPMLFTNSTASYAVNNGLDMAGKGGMTIVQYRTAGNTSRVADTVRGAAKKISTGDNTVEASTSHFLSFNSNGFTVGSSFVLSSSLASWSFCIAPKFFDIQQYVGQGNGSYVYHNLRVLPELLIIKALGAATDWYVAQINADGSGYTAILDSTAIGTSFSAGTFTPYVTDYGFIPDLGGTQTDDVGISYIAYMFATLAGISKVGVYTGNGGNLSVNCGFSAGARFVMIKRLDVAGDWMVFDTAQGIVAGNDPHLELNNTGAQVSDDALDPLSSGFIVRQAGAKSNANVSGSKYLFLAIA